MTDSPKPGISDEELGARLRDGFARLAAIDKPHPHPTPNRLAFAQAVKKLRVVRIDGHWWNTTTGRKADAAVAEFGHLIEPREDADGLTRAHLTNPGQEWLDTYGKNGADTP